MAKLKPGTTQDVFIGGRWQRAHHEQMAKEIKVGLHSKKGFTQMNENGNMDYGILVQMN